MTDKVAILLATYNGETYIREQIDSLLRQSYTEWALFIHDDGSTDRTPEIIRDYERTYPDCIHVLPGKPCGGAKENFFYIMRQVTAPYVMFCDQDDVWLPEKIEETLSQMKTLEAQSGTGIPALVFSDLSVVDGNLNLIADRMSVYQKLDPDRVRPENLMIQNVITGCTVMANRALVELALKVENTNDVIMHDWWFALVASVFGRISYVDKPLILYRQHGTNSIGAKKIGSVKYLQAKFKDGRGIKRSLAATQRQTLLFVNTYSVSSPVLIGYGHISKKTKVRRLWFYIKNDVKKCGWQRNLGFLIWG